MALLKSTANQYVFFYAIDTSTNLPKTGLTITAKIVKQSIGAWSGTGVSTNDGTAVTEIDSTNAKGWYYLKLNATDTACDYLIYSGTTATANVAITGGTVALTAVMPDVNVAQVAGSTSSATGLAAMGLFTNGTCEGGTSTTITLQTGSSALASTYVGQNIIITNGTGIGQVRTIVSYAVTTRIATLNYAWTTTPVAASSQYILTPGPGSDVTPVASAIPANAELATLPMYKAIGLLYQRFFGKVVKNSSTIKVKNSGGSTDITTQTYSTASNTDTINAAS